MSDLFFELEDGSGFIELEDGSGFLILEQEGAASGIKKPSLRITGFFPNLSIFALVVSTVIKNTTPHLFIRSIAPQLNIVSNKPSLSIIL